MRAPAPPEARTHDAFPFLIPIGWLHVVESLPIESVRENFPVTRFTD